MLNKKCCVERNNSQIKKKCKLKKNLLKIY